MVMLTIDQVNDLLDEMAEAFPPELFDGLNGGVNLLEEAKPDPDFPDGEMYILGEYCDDVLGQYINLYYGSFAALAKREDWDRETWEDELYTTLSHELTHHMEGRGGLHALDDRDAEELAEYHWTARCWPAFLAAGLVFLALSLAVEHTLGSVVLGILGCSSLWSILELREQEKRVERGWFPRNPRRKEKEDDRDLDHR